MGTERLEDDHDGIGWREAEIDHWLAETLDPVRSGYHANKLRGGGASERHLVIVIDSFSEAGTGISLMLNTHSEPGAGGDFLPTFVPPFPLTHLWILVSSANAYLRWERHEGWTIVVE